MPWPGWAKVFSSSPDKALRPSKPQYFLEEFRYDTYHWTIWFYMHGSFDVLQAGSRIRT
jgi:hypothetical protein